MWRNLRRLIGYWIAGHEVASVHCSHCGHITSAFCTRHRDEILKSMRTAEHPRVAAR
jgi:hypothetical protein